MRDDIAAELASLRQNTRNAFAAGAAISAGAVINSRMTAQDMLNIVTDNGPPKTTYVRDAFKYPERVLIPAGTRLYKFNTTRDLFIPNSAESRNEKPISAWWSPYHAYRHDPGWLQKRAMAQHFKVSIREYGRNTSAIKEDWNTLSWLGMITLKVSAWALFGGFAAMDRRTGHADNLLKQASKPYAKASYLDAIKEAGGNRLEKKGTTNRLPGGGSQFYIPNLYLSHIENYKVEPMVNI